MGEEIRIVFMGTPDFAVPTLQALADAYTVAGVVTQPDRPAGRGRALQASPVKQVASEMELAVFQPESLRDPDAVAQLRVWEPTVIVVAAFGQILQKDVLEMPPYGSLNLHASLLPRWRGAAPIQYAIWHGDAETGVTIMQMDEGLDTGPILSRRATPIGPRETAGTLHDRLAKMGADLLLETLPGHLAGDISPQPQPGEGVTHAPTLKKEAGRIDWTQTAIDLDRQVRAFDPWPGTFTYWHETRLKVISGEPVEDASSTQIGTVQQINEALAVATGDGSYVLAEVQATGGNPMTATAFANGHPEFVGARLG